MRTSRSAMLLVCLAFLVGPAAAATEEPGQVTVGVISLSGMEGLEVAVQIGSSPQPLHYSWEIEPVRRSIDASLITGELATFPVGEGTHEVVVMAGEPPCGVLWFAPLCAGSDADYACSIRLDVPPGEEVRLTIGGLPRYEPPPGGSVGFGIGPGCPVTDVRLGSLPSPE